MTIRLLVLGGLRGSRNGADLDWLGGKWLSTALLLYLAIERRSTREHLQTVFWPDADAATAGHRLNQALYALRRALGPDCIRTSGSQLVAGEQLEADALDFEQAVSGDRVTDAIELYRGPFLAGVHLAGTKEFENWVDGRRAKYARLHRVACRGALEERLAAGRAAAASEIARRWVAADPLDDEAQHRLIDVLWRSGDRSGALAQYGDYTRLLSGEGLEPLDETVALAARIRRGEGPAEERALSTPAEMHQPARRELPAGPGSGRHPPTERRSRLRRIVLVSLGVVSLAAASTLLAGTWPWAELLPVDERTPRAWTIVADFDGSAEASYRTAVREYVRDVLDQSKVVMAVPGEQVAEGLRLAGRAPEAVLDSDLARELARREKIRTIVSGRLDEVGSTFSFSLRLVAAEDGTVLFVTAPAIAAGTDAILPVARAAADQLRRHLGERRGLLGSGRFHNLEVTPSFEAWRKFAAGMEIWERRLDRRGRMDLMREALLHDPAFASAWIVLAVDHGLNGMRDSAGYALAQAQRFANGASELTRLRIEERAAAFRGDMHRALQVDDRMVQLFPDRPEPHFDRFHTLNWLDRFEESLETLRKTQSLYPFGPRVEPRLSEIRSLLRLGRSEEAWQAAKRMGTTTPWGQNAHLIAALGGSRWTDLERLMTQFEPDLGPLSGIRGPVHSARGQPAQAEAMLLMNRTHQARRLRILLSSASGLPLAPLDSAVVEDTRLPALITKAYAAVVAGDTAQAHLLIEPFAHRPDGRMEYGAWVGLLEGLIAQARGDPSGVLELAPLARRTRGDIVNHWQSQGVGASVLQWFVGRAFEAAGQPDSAAAYYALIVSPIVETLTAYANELSRALLYSFARQRLVVLNARMGRLAVAREHWKILDETVTDPDPEFAALLEQARAALRRSEQRREGTT